MNTKNFKERAKKYWKENGRDILFYTVGFTVGGVAFYKLGQSLAVPYERECSKRIRKVLSYGPKRVVSVFTGVIEDGLTITDLGEIGVKMEELGAPSDIKYKQFVLIGDPIKK